MMLVRRTDLSGSVSWYDGVAWNPEQSSAVGVDKLKADSLSYCFGPISQQFQYHDLETGRVVTFDVAGWDPWRKLPEVVRETVRPARPPDHRPLIPAAAGPTGAYRTLVQARYPHAHVSGWLEGAPRIASDGQWLGPESDDGTAPTAWKLAWQWLEAGNAPVNKYQGPGDSV